jgi:hypothetical protein
MKKFFALFILLIILLPTISLNVSSFENEDGTDESNERSAFLDFLLRLRFRLGFYPVLFMGRYFVRQLRPPVPIQPYPTTVTLDYHNKTIVQIGGKNETGEWQKLVKISGTYDWGWMSPTIVYTFEFVPPENAEEDVFNVEFDPKKLVMKTNKENLDWPGAEQPIKTNMSIRLKPSVDPTFPTQDIVLKVNIVREEVLDKYRILTGPPKYPITQRDEYLKKIRELDVKNPYWESIPLVITHRIYGRFFILFMNLQLPGYDKWIDSTVEVLVKVNPYHKVDIPPILPQKIEPYEVKSIPMTIKNIGSHLETLNFRVSYDNEELIVTPPPAMTLQPGEVGQALVGVAAPKQFLSVGATTEIFVEAYSIDDPESVFTNTITLTTTGIQIAGGPTYVASSIVVALIIVLLIVVIFFRKRRNKYCTKPNKPWEIPKEKEHLEKLKKKDKEQYNKTLEMMREEYESSLLWHKYYIDAEINRKNKLRIDQEAKKRKEKFEIKAKIRKEKKAKEIEEKEKEKTQEKDKEKSKKKQAVEFKEVEPESPEEKEEEVSLLDKKEDLERRKREITVSRIKRQQEKQKRKYKSSV